MNLNYYLSKRLIASVLLVSLFLQSCGGFYNSSLPQAKERRLADISPSLANQAAINLLLDKEFTAEGGHLVTLHEENGNLQADIRVDEKQPKPNYRNLPVAIERDTDLANLVELDPKIQKSRIQLERSQSGKLSRVYIFKQGAIVGGMSSTNIGTSSSNRKDNKKGKEIAQDDDEELEEEEDEDIPEEYIDPITQEIEDEGIPEEYIDPTTHEIKDKDIPEEYIDPITYEIMEDPVSTQEVILMRGNQYKIGLIGEIALVLTLELF